jgi:hypothetical protein
MKLTIQIERDDLHRIISSLITIPEFVSEAEIEPLIGGTVEDLWRIAEYIRSQLAEE